MAIGAHEFAVGDLLDDLAQAVALTHEKAHLGSFWSNMIELEHERIGETAVSTAPRQQQFGDESPGDCSPLVASSAGLTSVQVASCTDVFAATVLALTLLAVKARQWQRALTAWASCGSDRLGAGSQLN